MKKAKKKKVKKKKTKYKYDPNERGESRSVAVEPDKIRQEKRGLGIKAQRLRALATYTNNPGKPQFAKNIRRMFSNIPGKVQYRSKQWFLKLPKQF